MMSEAQKLLRIHSPEGTDYLSNSDIPDPRFHASPTRRVRFPNGKIVPMNRRQRRRAHIYGDRVTKVRL